MAGYATRAARAVTNQNLNNLASALIAASIIVAFLYIGGAILEPLVIAALLAFILSPVIRRLRRWGLWRIPAVALTVASAIALIGVLSTTIVMQITQLAEDLPKYEANLRTKVRALSGAPLTSGVLDRASGTLRDLQNEINPWPEASVAGGSAATRAQGTRGAGQPRAASPVAAGDDRAGDIVPAFHPAAA